MLFYILVFNLPLNFMGYAVYLYVVDQLKGSGVICIAQPFILVNVTLKTFIEQNISLACSDLSL
jgi:hypothetical protein